MNVMILPFSEPIIHGFSHQAVLTSIMMAYDRCKPWICNNYIQMFTLNALNYSLRSGTVDFFYAEYVDFNRGEYKNNPWIRYNEVPLFLVDQTESSLLDKFIQFIDVGYYLNVDLDEYYIPAYDVDWHQEHTILIYGYDKKNETFYCVDNFVNGKLSTRLISFDDLIRSVESRLNYYKIHYEFTTSNPGPLMATIGIVDAIEDRQYSGVKEVDQKRISYLLTSYLHPEKFFANMNNNEYYVYGVNVFDEIIAYIKEAMYSKQKIDIRGLYSMLDHKKLMIWRLKYMQDRLQVDFESQLSTYELIRNKLEKEVFLLLKYNLNGFCYIDRIIQNLENCMCLDKKVTEEVIGILSTVQ